MRAVDHYLAAEDDLEAAEQAPGGTARQQALMYRAQVHAALALAGATAMHAYTTSAPDDPELADWEDAAGGRG